VKGWLYGRSTGLVLIGALAAVATALGLYFGSYGECRADSDCAPGNECMAWSFESRPWWARGMTYRTCETPCHRPEDCPRGYECLTIDHGPGPKAHCRKWSRTEQ